MAASPRIYVIRIKGRLGATARSAFPSMAAEPREDETVLTGSLEDRSALFGVLAQIEALGLELLEVRQPHEAPRPPDDCPGQARGAGESPGPGDDRSPSRGGDSAPDPTSSPKGPAP